MLTVKTLKILYQTMSAAFCIVAVLSNIISAKMTTLSLFQNFSIPAGLITYPLTFLLGDLVTEIFGVKKAKQMVFIAFGMNLLSFGILYLALLLPAPSSEENLAFQAVLGFSGWRIFSSLSAYLISQLADIQIYALIKRWTGERLLWLRNNGATLTSQLIDTIIVDLIYLYWGLHMEVSKVFLIILFSYAYKAAFSAAATPLFYTCVFLIRKKWNGSRLAFEECL